MSHGTLYLVGTPIGNRGDLAPRAREVLSAVPIVACEDTRICRRLFSWLELPLPELIAYHDHNAEVALDRAMVRLTAGHDVALVSDAGMPAVQDPGYRLVVAARRAGVAVVPVPGPSALVLALAASGLPTDRFAFLGFAPRRGRESWWGSALSRQETIIVYEAASRVVRTLRAIEAMAPARPICLAREMTKVHEEFVTGTAAEIADELDARDAPIKGECAIVIGGSEESSAHATAWRDALACIEASRAADSLSARDVVDVLSCVYPEERNAIYEAVHSRNSSAP